MSINARTSNSQNVKKCGKIPILQILLKIFLFDEFLGQMLNAREPKIVNGPEVLDKYVGESEAKIRALFAEAEAEERSMGPLSGLHIIIFDEIDAICKARGSLAGSSGVNDTVVNQLLSKIDGVEQLNNILVIGMTNRKDMIDEALMRPGRLEVQIGKYP